jgi:hypothetical protein
VAQAHGDYLAFIFMRGGLSCSHVAPAMMSPLALL